MPDRSRALRRAHGIAVVIGQVTPPMAIALVITGRIADVDQLRVFRANLPFVWGMLAFLLLIMAVPELPPGCRASPASSMTAALLETLAPETDPCTYGGSG